MVYPLKSTIYAQADLVTTRMYKTPKRGAELKACPVMNMYPYKLMSSIICNLQVIPVNKSESDRPTDKIAVTGGPSVIW